jgi:hypothetical protein
MKKGVFTQPGSFASLGRFGRMSAITRISTDPATRQDGQNYAKRTFPSNRAWQRNFSRNVTPITEPLGAAVTLFPYGNAFSTEAVMKKALTDTLIALVLAAGSW